MTGKMPFLVNVFWASKILAEDKRKMQGVGGDAAI